MLLGRYREMNDNAKMWVSALRSGVYVQARGSLRVESQELGTKFCCLGVACDLYSKSVGEGSWTEEGWFELRNSHGLDTNGSDVFLPEDVMEWLGLSHVQGKFFNRVETSGGLLTGLKEDNSLTDMNDNDSTFEDIAKIIEEEPRGLFIGTEE